MRTNDLFLGFEKRREIKRSEKEKISEKAVEFILSGEEIFLGAGTTLSFVGEKLASSDKHINLKIWTNNIFIVNIFLKEHETFFNQNFVGLVAGEISRKNLSVINIYFPFSTVEKIFLGTPGITEKGLSSDDVYTVQQVEHIVRKAKKIILLADDSKIGRECVYQTRSMRMIKIDIKNGKEYILITNFSKDQKFQQTIKKLKQAGMKVYLV